MSETIGLPHWTVGDALPKTGDPKVDAALKQRLQAIQENFEGLVTQTAKQLAGAFEQRVPPGVIDMYGSTTPPTGYLGCSGQAVSRATYADLFDVIGTAYGVGDGVSTFNLPPLNIGNFPRGAIVVGGSGGSLTTEESGDAPFLVAPGAPFDPGVVGFHHTHDFMPPFVNVFFIIKT